MIIKKAGTPVSAKKSVEEMKKLNERKKMMKEESEEEEEEDTSEEGDEEESESGADEGNSDEGSEEDDDSDEEDEEEDDDDEDEDDDDFDESEEEVAASSKKQQKGQVKMPAKSAKTPNKTPNKESLQASLQKNVAQSNKKTPIKKRDLFEMDSSMSTSPKKTVKADENAAKMPSLFKQQKDTSIFKGKTEKRKKEDSDEEETSKKPRSDAPANTFVYGEDRRQRDLRSLFVRDFPKGTTEDELKGLSPDIIAARFPGKRKAQFAFIEFASEKKAIENFPILEKARLKGKKLYIDYVGEKSKKFKPPQVTPTRQENKKRVFLSGLPSNVTIKDIGEHFLNSIAIFLRPSGNVRYAHVDFETDAAGEEAYKRNSSLTIRGQPVTVMRGLVNKRRKPSKQKVAEKDGKQKRMAMSNQKTPKKEEEEDDEEDDDDDDNDEEDESDDDESDEE